MTMNTDRPGIKNVGNKGQKGVREHVLPERVFSDKALIDAYKITRSDALAIIGQPAKRQDKIKKWETEFGYNSKDLGIVRIHMTLSPNESEFLQAIAVVQEDFYQGTSQEKILYNLKSLAKLSNLASVRDAASKALYNLIIRRADLNLGDKMDLSRIGIHHPDDIKWIAENADSQGFDGEYIRRHFDALQITKAKRVINYNVSEAELVDAIEKAGRSDPEIRFLIEGIMLFFREKVKETANKTLGESQ